MSEEEKVMLSGIPPEVETENLPAPIPMDPVDENKPPDDQSLTQTDLDMPKPTAVSESQNQSGKLTDLSGMNRNFKNIWNEERVVTIDRQRSVQTNADKQMNNLLDLLESLRSRKIVTGKIAGVENTGNGVPSAVLQYGEFKVVIPYYECVDPPGDFRDQDPNDVYRYMLTKELGTEIDFIVKGIDQEGGLVVASRKEAMAVRRRQFYFGQDREGNNILYEGVVAEARITAVIRTGIFVELFGVQSYIPVNELSYNRIIDAAHHFQNGQRTLVKILKLDRSDPKNISVTLSVKQTQPNPYESVSERFTIGNLYIGTVTMVDINGIFVSLDCGVDVLCPFPIRGRPLITSRATVRITHIDEELKRMRGEIVYTSFTLR